MTICEPCPFLGTLNAASNLVGRLQPSNADHALGGIALTTSALEEVSITINCPGPAVSNATGQYDCPLKESAYGARSMAAAPWSLTQFTVPLSNLAPGSSTGADLNTGQYL